MGLSFSQMCLSPFLKIWVILSYYIFSGNIPVFKDCFTMSELGPNKIGSSCFNNLVESPSYPKLVLQLNFLIICVT